MIRILIIAMFLFPAIAAKGRIVLNTKNTVALDEAVSAASIKRVQEELAELVIKRGSADYKIYLTINSPGGEIYPAASFVEFASGIRDLETVTIFAASAAAWIVQALPGKRHTLHTGVYMFHRASAQMSGQFETGELEQRLMFWKLFVREMEFRVSKRIGISLEEYKKRVKDEWWVHGWASPKLGVADQVSKVACTFTLVKKRVERAIHFFGLRKVIKKSACPLFS